MPPFDTSIEPDFQAALTRSWPASQWRDVHLVAAVSGGADSVALLRGLVAIRQQAGGEGQIVAAHFNHGLRGDAANEDAAWVKRLCQRLGVACQTGQANLTNDSEQAARDARYDFLSQVAHETGARYVATGHTRDDQVETVLHRLFRGSGLAGLAGMRLTRQLSEGVTLVRPMLDVTRAGVEAYLLAIQQEHRQDHTNDDPRYTRNWIRHELLPLIKDRVGDASAEAVVGLSGQAAEVQALVDAEAQKLLVLAFDLSPTVGTIRIETAQLDSQSLLLIREACRQAWRAMGWPEQAMGRAQWDLLAAQATADSEPAPICLPGGVRVERRQRQLLLARLPS